MKRNEKTGKCEKCPGEGEISTDGKSE